MKTKLAFLMISIVLIIGGCKKDSTDLPDALTMSKLNLDASFSILDQHMTEATQYMISVDMDTSLVRSQLLQLVGEFPYITDFAEVTPAGIMRIIEPAEFYAFQGTDISNQDHVIKAFETKQPVLSRQFLTVEGFYAAVVIHPIVNNSAIEGGITAMFYPKDILGSIMAPLSQGQPFELWAMDMQGIILFDLDSAEIGLNLFTAPLYQDFPELITAGSKILSEDSGTTKYSFFKAGTSETVTKLTYWDTFELYGTQWKLVWVKPE
jgi:hypothetical protein